MTGQCDHPDRDVSYRATGDYDESRHARCSACGHEWITHPEKATGGFIKEFYGTKYAVFNPHNKPVEELPIIYGFNNGGSREWYSAQLLAEDGTALGGHVCSHEGFMYGDLGILEGSRPDRHETFRAHYPDGYRMDFVPESEVRKHEGVMTAYQRNQARAAIAKAEGETP